MVFRKQVLLSSYACSPIWGSEPGVGWKWVIELASHHDVTVVTHSYFKEQIDEALENNSIPGLTFSYFQARTFGLHPHTQLNSRIYYIWWQFKLRGFLKKLMESQSFDLLHHLTWGTFRFPTFLGRMGIPLVMGPLGGGEDAPMRLYKGLPLKHRLVEWLRSLSLQFSRFDPLAMLGPAASVLIFCKTEETRNSLPVRLRDRAVIAFEIGAPDISKEKCSSGYAGTQPLRLLFAGQLRAVKGIPLAILAVANLIKAGRNVQLDIAGEGPLRSHLESEIDRLSLRKHVKLLGVIPRQELMALYSEADLFIFPSLHDSSGNVVLESLSRGLPVLCLDLGGPKYYVNSECGVIVDTHAKSIDEVARAIATEISILMDEPNKLEAMSAEAFKQAAIQTWGSRVDAVYREIALKLGWKG